ncbi:hypothetical protein LJB91_00430 [Bacteroidales bacterium OttesenSCG-928-L03]|nr:hypothetical protein [Bacteroidales bacterium OttesenSCG-928-L03]
MNRIDLHEEFLKALNKKGTSRRSELVNIVSDTLRIERESASRRLSGKVQFSAREVGILARRLDISLDSLMQTDDDYLWFPLRLQPPLSIPSLDVLCDKIDSNIEQMEEIVKEPAESGSVFNSLPIEFYMHHPTLMRFMIFKWGYYFVGTEEYDHFSTFQLPKRLVNIKDRIDNVFAHVENSFYIWDDSLIVILVKEIENFHRMHIINDEEKEVIRLELKALMNNLEQYIKHNFHPRVSSSEVSFYASTMNIGLTCTYFLSKTMGRSSIQTAFISSGYEYDYNHCIRIKEWMHSLRNISILLSESGHIERRIFFDKQQNIVDSLSGKA